MLLNDAKISDFFRITNGLTLVISFLCFFIILSVILVMVISFFYYNFAA